jgi:hypothetical protein
MRRFLNICVFLNDNGGNKLATGGVRKSFRYVDQFMILYHSLIRYWSPFIDFHVNVFHSVDFDDEDEKKIRALKRVKLIKGPCDDSRLPYNSSLLCYGGGLKQHSSHRLILDVDMVANGWKDLDWNADYQASVWNSKAPESMIHYLENDMGVRNTVRLQGGALLIREEHCRNFVRALRPYKETLFKDYWNNKIPDKDIDMASHFGLEVSRSILLQKMYSKQSIFPKGFNVLGESKAVGAPLHHYAGTHFLKRLMIASPYLFTYHHVVPMLKTYMHYVSKQSSNRRQRLVHSGNFVKDFVTGFKIEPNNVMWIYNKHDKHIPNDMKCNYVGSNEINQQLNNAAELVVCEHVLSHSTKPWEICKDLTRISRRYVIVIARFEWRYLPLPVDCFRFTHDSMSSMFEEYVCDESWAYESLTPFRSDEHDTVDGTSHPRTRLIYVAAVS